MVFILLLFVYVYIQLYFLTFSKVYLSLGQFFFEFENPNMHREFMNFPFSILQNLEKFLCVYLSWY